MEYRKLGRFQIDSKIAEGGMGELIRSVDDAGRPIVLKKILKSYRDDPRFRDLFVREAEITFQLDHPNIVKAFRFETIGNQLVLALEFLDGRNLREILREIYDRKLSIPLSIVMGVMERVLKGLHYAHTRADEGGKPLRIIHRDLNPSNIFLTYAGEVKILDFGISKASANDVHHLTPQGELRGKMGYLSPEQIRGDDVDHRSDLYTLGIVFWEMLAGRPLYLRESNSQVLDAIHRSDYVSLSEFRPDLPQACNEFLKIVLASSPHRRPRSALEMLKLMRKLLSPHIVPGLSEDELSIFVRSLFRHAIDEKDPHFVSGYGWLMAQVRGQERGGLELVKRMVEAHASIPYVQLNWARACLAAGDRLEGLRIMRKLARVDSLQDHAQHILEWLGVRRRPVIGFLKRSHPLNHALGRIRHRLLGPTPYQQEFLAA